MKNNNFNEQLPSDGTAAEGILGLLIWIGISVSIFFIGLFIGKKRSQ
jgi:hypothetical protein